MANGDKSIYKTSRERAGLTQEVAAELLNISVDQFRRYESGKVKPSDDMVDRMIEIYSDERLGYLYLLDNKVGRRLLPRGVERGTMLEAIVKTSLATKDFIAGIDHMLKAAVDGQITEAEVKEYTANKDNLKEVVKGYYAMDFADGSGV